jgi:hypothetical protein
LNVDFTKRGLDSLKIELIKLDREKGYRGPHKKLKNQIFRADLVKVLGVNISTKALYDNLIGSSSSFSQ